MKALGVVIAIISVLTSPVALLVFLGILAISRVLHRNLMVEILYWGSWH